MLIFFQFFTLYIKTLKLKQHTQIEQGSNYIVVK